MNAPLPATQAKQARRAAMEAALAVRQLALPDKRYGVIVADPPWRWEPYSRETGMDVARAFAKAASSTGNGALCSSRRLGGQDPHDI